MLVATDFFTAEVWTLGGLVTYDVLFFLHLGSRKVYVAGVTPHPHEAWMVPVARHVTMQEWGSCPLASLSCMTETPSSAPRFNRSLMMLGSRGSHCRRRRRI